MSSTSTARVGDTSEALAVAYFLDNGLEVFPSARNSGPIDIVTVDPKTGATTLWDVKTCGYKKSSKRVGLPTNQNPSARGLGVRLLYVLNVEGATIVSEIDAEFLEKAKECGLNVPVGYLIWSGHISEEDISKFASNTSWEPRQIRTDSSCSTLCRVSHYTG